jgi:hypothetical protein
MFFKLAERLADVAGDGRFFRDDECFTHVLRQSLSREPPVAQLKFFPGNKIPLPPGCG